MNSPTETLGLRAWWALNCLPRDEFGNLPEFRPLERAHELSNNQLRRIIWDATKRPGYATIMRVAAALNCDPAWLAEGKGPRPVPSQPILPRPPEPKGLTSRLSSTVVSDFAKDSQELSSSSKSALRRARK